MERRGFGMSQGISATGTCIPKQADGKTRGDRIKSSALTGFGQPCRKSERNAGIRQDLVRTD